MKKRWRWSVGVLNSIWPLPAILYPIKVPADLMLSIFVPAGKYCLNCKSIWSQRKVILGCAVFACFIKKKKEKKGYLCFGSSNRWVHVPKTKVGAFVSVWSVASASQCSGVRDPFVAMAMATAARPCCRPPAWSFHASRKTELNFQEDRERRRRVQMTDESPSWDINYVCKCTGGMTNRRRNRGR